MTARHGLTTGSAILFIGMLVSLCGCASYGEAQAFEEFRQATADNYNTTPLIAESRGVLRPAPTTSPADDLPADPTLKDYLTYAAMHNPGLEAAFARWKAALERIPQARALDDPQFGYRWFVRAQAMRDGNITDVFEISQAFPWFGKLQLRGDVALQEANALQKQFEAEQLKLANRVTQAYCEYYYLGRTIAITRKTLEQFQYTERIARARYRTSASSAPDVLRAQQDLARMENELQSSEDLRDSAAAKLNAAMGRQSSVPLPWPAKLPQQAEPPTQGELVAWMIRSSPELKALDFEVAREARSVELAGLDYFPDFEVGMEYGLMESSSQVPPEMSPEDPIAVMFRMNVPIWFEKYAAGVREAKARRWAAAREKDERQNSLVADLKTAAYNLRNAQRKIVLYRDTLLPKAQQSLKSIQSSYQTERSSFLDLADAQRVLLEFELNYERAMTDRQQSLAELEALVGRPLPGGKVPK